MSTTTQILFNSPALHSLKRDQLVKLCKIHSLKANGKNIEIIERLKQHAITLPKDSPLSIAARSDQSGIVPASESENTDEDDSGSNLKYMPRPSEQWEVVMDSIQECEENSSQGTMSSQRTLGGTTGEFGTGSSKSNPTTVSSSIKALANSLGLKRSTTKTTIASFSSSKSSIPPVPFLPDELRLNSTPYSALPPSTSLPQTDHFTFTPSRLSSGSLGDTDPLPGHALRPGVPAPTNARLSMGLGLTVPSTPARKQPTTTIRLISNPLATCDTTTSSYGAGEHGTPQLKPFETTFDLILGSPTSNVGSGFGFGSLSSWPPRADDEMQGIYPTLTIDDLPPPMTPTKPTYSPPDCAMEESRDAPGELKVSAEPFVFGSPLPQHNVSNDQFRSAAASVLEEMNKRLQDEGVEGVGMNLISTLQAGAHSQSDLAKLSRETKALPDPQRGEIKEKFERVHEQEFKKMEGIDGFLKRRPAGKREEEERVVVGKKRKSSVLGTGAGRDAHGRRIPGAAVGRISATRVISNGRRARVIPGAFGDEDSDEEEEKDESEEKRAKMDEDEREETEAEKKKKEEELDAERLRIEKEREAIKRKLEISKARRRSSVAPGGLQGRKSGRVSVGRGGVLAKPKPSRFGFLSSAKNIVASVWGRNKPVVVPPSSIPKPAPVTKPAPTPAMLTKKPPVPLARPSTATPVTQETGSRVPSLCVTKDKEGTIASTSSRSRSPIPSFGPAPSTRGSIVTNGTGTRASRNSSLAGTSRNGSLAGASRGSTGVSRTSSAGVSSIGTRASSSRVSAGSSAVGSMGSKKLLGGPAARASTTGSSSSRPSSTSSRLLAPTASSLAKMSRPSVPGLKAVAEDHAFKPSSLSKDAALGLITNNPAVTARVPFSPRSGGIFSKPLELPSGIPTPVKKRPTAPTSTDNGDSANETMQDNSIANSSTVVRQRTFTRKPRISRSKVIARLASQRAAATAGTGSSAASSIAPRASNGGGKTRSSFGAKAQRASYAGGAGKRGSAGGDIIMSAKKRARQSEYARRRSQVKPIAAMDIDQDDD
ncbi:hypothetical protein BDQ12DRAFT_693663 [Crucibulum laeve]|uniref:SAP domain-containing protein n=1 Tax=Crucibulum laeve TaxID=68775 RepID=A0A5C3LIJ3_9AGAR|nr:hypothetical protein BDQ12DRAFT_693663 [Crucibulum laeve]